MQRRQITFVLFSNTPIGIWRRSNPKIARCREQTLQDAEESVIASADLSGTTRTFQAISGNATRGSQFAAHSASNVSKLSAKSMPMPRPSRTCKANNRRHRVVETQ